MANVNDVLGSGLFKERVKTSSVTIEFVKSTGKVKKTTIGVVLVCQPRRWCYIIAPKTKFSNNMKKKRPLLVQALWNGFDCVILPEDMEISQDIVKFYLRCQHIEATEMQIADVLPLRHESIFLFCSKHVGQVIQPGNVTLPGEDYFKHDCPSPDPVETINRTEKENEITLTHSGEILLHATGRLLGFVLENDPTDRTAAVSATAIRRQVMNINETIDVFRQRIVRDAPAL